MVNILQIKITKEKRLSDIDGFKGVDSIRYNLRVPSRKNSGFGTLVAILLNDDNSKWTEWTLSKIEGLRYNDVFAHIVDFFPNGYSHFPCQPTNHDERRMRKGTGSVLLDEMIEDARKEFGAKAIGGVGCSYSMSKFFEKKNFITVYSGYLDDLGTYYIHI